MPPGTAATASDAGPIHASTVALPGPEGPAVLIMGPSGSGKSALALNLMALGCVLVADDRTFLHRDADGLVATCPPALAGMIEARGVGLLGAEHRASAPVRLAVDLGRIETERLPPRRIVTLLGCRIPLLHKAETGHYSASVLQYLKAGRRH